MLSLCNKMVTRKIYEPRSGADAKSTNWSLGSILNFHPGPAAGFYSGRFLHCGRLHHCITNKRNEIALTTPRTTRIKYNSWIQLQGIREYVWSVGFKL